MAFLVCFVKCGNVQLIAVQVKFIWQVKKAELNAKKYIV
jgi:hypothetical protein